jgi:5-methyltetrahydrofolate--homocysteine methyltransferase
MERLSQGPVLMDGGLGTALIARGLPAGILPEQWVLEQSDIVLRVHRDYYEAGSSLVTTNTFNSNEIRLSAAGLLERQEEIIQQAVALVKRVAPVGSWVAGDLGPTGRYVKPLGDLDIEACEQVFQRQAELLSQAGVDLLLIETMYSLDEARAAVRGCRTASELPVCASMTFNRTPKGFFTLMGENPARCVIELQREGAHIIGSNCSLTSSEMVDLLPSLMEHADTPIMIKPNAGQPQLEGDTVVYPQDPQEFADQMIEIVRAGASLVGGCCGTDARFIRALAARMERIG